ncbi:winged helix-turn-helix transcriptional regulator [Candidatus Poribacteria bacterium]
MAEDRDTKFRVKAELALFEALQKDGRLSEEKISKKTGTSATTVHYALDRIRGRDFFKVMAVPKLEKFPEIPMAIIGFSNVHPVKIKELKEKYANKPEVTQFFHGEKDAVIFLMDSKAEALTEKLFGIMDIAQEKPSVYITSPVVAKHCATIPDKVLEGVYSGLPDRRFKA